MDIGCYIVFSERLNRYYIGACQSSLNERIEKHNSGYYGKAKFTAQSNDWELVLFLETETYAHALRLERKIKRMKSSRYIKNLLQYEELRAKVIKETRGT